MEYKRIEHSGVAFSTCESSQWDKNIKSTYSVAF